MEKKVYLVEREKAGCTYRVFAGNYRTVLDILFGLDGTDEVINVYFTNVVYSQNGQGKNL